MLLLLLCLIPYFFKYLFCNYDFFKTHLYIISFYSEIVSIPSPVLVPRLRILVHLFFNLPSSSNSSTTFSPSSSSCPFSDSNILAFDSFTFKFSFKYATKSVAVTIPKGLFISLFSTTSKCLTLFCIITSAAASTGNLESIVTNGEDIIFFINIVLLLLLLLVSLTHTFLTKSRSVTIPVGLLLLSSITTSELTLLSLIFFDASRTELRMPIVSIF